MSIIDDTITRLQQIALLTASGRITAAPQAPIESASRLPMAVAYISGGNASATHSGDATLFLNITVEIHVNEQTLKSAFADLNAIIPDYLQRLCGDPTLNSNVTTIIYPVTFDVAPSQWATVKTAAAIFTIPCKFRKESV